MPGQADDSASDEGFHEILAEDAAMAGRKRRRIFQQLRDKDVVSKDDIVANIPGTTPGGSKPTQDKDVVFKDDIVANIPGTAPGGSKPTPDKGKSAALLLEGDEPIFLSQ